ncbi:class I SAM-dependent methyltransferase [Mobilicoccus sp.]|uniref:class I SAM-dependent methyltransferase n=1 Tax=Mobilicoccus sp. TaxID=2034349 RepID=UPI002899BC42|nr:class I SAM-dependent methyltransferase [Mobilicoccus sp.]
MSADARRRGADAFTRGGGAYERLRPTYPRAAVAWALATAPPGRVADVGAGTGKLTHVLLDLGRDVVALDPSRDMLARLRASSRGASRTDLDIRVGRGEQTGLDDASVSAVVYGQAWHWVDADVACEESARILVPGGTLALVWNLMDVDDPATAACHRAMHVLSEEGGEHTDSVADVTAAFGRRESRTFRWSRHLNTRELADTVTTRSYYLAADEPDRARLRAAVAAAVTQHFGPLGEAVIEVPHLTEVHRFTRA